MTTENASAEMFECFDLCKTKTLEDALEIFGEPYIEFIEKIQLSDIANDEYLLRVESICCAYGA